MSLPFPNISPIALNIGPLNVTWYGISYAVGIFLAWRYILFLLKKHSSAPLTPKTFDDFIVWAIFAIIIGGRLGYTLFYKPLYYLSHPFEILYTWEGGMSFHGGLLGVLLAALLFCRSKKVPFLQFTDFLACAAPIGLFLGRLSNFINGELYGRTTSVAWGIYFPKGGPVPRHPSQLYEAFFEGFFLFFLLFFLARKEALWKKQGYLTGIGLIGYGLLRIGCEFYRLPDSHLGFFFDHLTLGQFLSLPMILLGGALLKNRKRFF